MKIASLRCLFKEYLNLSSDGTFLLMFHSTYQMDENFSPAIIDNGNQSEEISFFGQSYSGGERYSYEARFNLF